jgi:aspartate-semialdehyde dehydrogenase
MKKYNIAIVGATGAVGEELLLVLDELNFPVANILPLSSARSAGTYIEFRNEEYKVYELTTTVFDEHEVDIAFFCAGGSISEKYAKYAVESGAVVIDNTSFFRMDEDIPLVVPEVNPQDIAMWEKRGIIANPNCSTIQMTQSLKALDNVYPIKRVFKSPKRVFTNFL